MQFCVKCGAALSPAPAPESWKVSGDIGTQTPPPPQSSYTPPASYQGYTPQPPAVQFPGQQTGEPMHPAIPAVVSLFLPGAGLLFLPNKAGLGIGILAGWVGYIIIAFILSFVFIGFCLFLVMPLIHIGAGIFTYDEAAKASGGRFQPLLFK
jgi:hypothetical protein